MSHRILFVQLPIPQLNYRKQTGNIPLAAGYLYQTISHLKNVEITILKESESTYLSDTSLIEKIVTLNPSIICFSVYCWNLHRSIYIHDQLKSRISFISIAGGPEITKDNYQLINHPFNHLVHGEGELPFCVLIHKITKNDLVPFQINNDLISPYLLDILEPEISNTLFLETQRGCPYNCGFCYYNKDRKNMVQFSEEKVIKTVEYAMNNENINQIYFMDPSLNSRRDLKTLLKKISLINKDHKLELYSEIRAEFMTNDWALQFKNAGFKEFEVGLQSINQEALKIMERPTDLKRFVTGCQSLQLYDITPKIDLIVGLPGDNPDSFKKSVDFLYDHKLDESIQVLPLSILPGTSYRRKSSQFEIEYQFDPPYYVQKSTNFSWNDMFNSFKYAESKLEFDLFPDPVIDLSYTNENSNPNLPYSKLYFNHEIDHKHIIRLSNNLCHPYQLYFSEQCQNPIFIKNVINCFTKNNPFTSFELIFFEPKNKNLYDLINSFTYLSEKSFLTNDLDFSSSEKKNRSFFISIISASKIRKSSDSTQRQLYHWTSDSLPKKEDIFKLLHLDGIFIDKNYQISKIQNWQNEMYRHIVDEESDYDFVEFPLENFFSFSLKEAQDYWIELFFKNEFCLKIKHNLFIN